MTILTGNSYIQMSSFSCLYRFITDLLEADTQHPLTIFTPLRLVSLPSLYSRFITAARMMRQKSHCHKTGESIRCGLGNPLSFRVVHQMLEEELQLTECPPAARPDSQVAYEAVQSSGVAVCCEVLPMIGRNHKCAFFRFSNKVPTGRISDGLFLRLAVSMVFELLCLWLTYS